MIALLLVGAVATYFLVTLKDWENTINHGYPPDTEYSVNFWTRKRTQVIPRSTDKQKGG